MLAYSGDFAGARELLSAGHAPREAAWRRDDGAVEAFTKGWMSFWSGDNVEAFGAFQDASAAGGAITSVAPLARLWLVHTVLARRDAAELDGAERLLADVPDTTIQGLPWGVYKLCAQGSLPSVATCTVLSRSWRRCRQPRRSSRPHGYSRRSCSG